MKGRFSILVWRRCSITTASRVRLRQPTLWIEDSIAPPYMTMCDGVFRAAELQQASGLQNVHLRVNHREDDKTSKRTRRGSAAQRDEKVRHRLNQNLSHLHPIAHAFGQAGASFPLLPLAQWHMLVSAADCRASTFCFGTPHPPASWLGLRSL